MPSPFENPFIPGYYDLPGSQMLPGGKLAVSPGSQGQARSMSGIDIPLPGSGGALPLEYQTSIPGAGLPFRSDMGGPGQNVPLNDWNTPFTPTDTYYGEPTVYAPGGQQQQQPQPSGFGIPSVPSPMSGYPDLSNAPPVIVGGGNAAGTPSGISPLQHALNVLASNFAQQQNMNAFALHDWNRGAWQANPTGREDRVADNRHNIGALAARLGLMGRGGGGRMPVNFQ